jgi:hypothetical protein
MIKKTFALLIFFTSCSLLETYPDSYLEEKAEEAIESLTGVDVDLTAKSCEKPCKP